jgi:menaquinone-dependent protoporphyrinogen oxidase
VQNTYVVYAPGTDAFPSIRAMLRSMNDYDLHDRVLVAYGTKHGSTAEIAEAIAKALRTAGAHVDVQRARDVHSLASYRAVVIGSAVYAGRWRHDALALLGRDELRRRDVWLFSSGPIGKDATDPEKLERWTKPQRVEQIAAEIGAHEHVVFGGVVGDDSGFIRKKMARNLPTELRDMRDWREIEGWALSIAAALSKPPVPA